MCIVCSKFYSVNTVKTHQAKCREKNGGKTSNRYYCKSDGCNFEKPELPISKRVMEQHMRKEHDIHDPQEIERNYELKINNELQL